MLYRYSTNKKKRSALFLFLGSLLPGEDIRPLYLFLTWNGFQPRVAVMMRGNIVAPVIQGTKRRVRRERERRTAYDERRKEKNDGVKEKERTREGSFDRQPHRWYHWHACTETEKSKQTDKRTERTFLKEPEQKEKESSQMKRLHHSSCMRSAGCFWESRKEELQMALLMLLLIRKTLCSFLIVLLHATAHTDSTKHYLLASEVSSRSGTRTKKRNERQNRAK